MSRGIFITLDALVAAVAAMFIIGSLWTAFTLESRDDTLYERAQQTIDIMADRELIKAGMNDTAIQSVLDQVASGYCAQLVIYDDAGVEFDEYSTGCAAAEEQAVAWRTDKDMVIGKLVMWRE